jgi:hypothetical protein
MLIKFILMIIFSTAQAEVIPFKFGPEGMLINRHQAFNIEKMLSQKLDDKSINIADAEDIKKVQNIIALSKKASKWITIVNTKRPMDQQLDISRKQNSGGIPITAPQLSNTKIMQKRLDDYLSTTNPLIANAITDMTELSLNPPVSDEEFVASLRILDRIYQSTIRWASAMNSLDGMAKGSVNDMRGYIFLNKISNLEETLKSYPSMMPAEQVQYTDWLIELCRNGKYELLECSNKLAPYISANNLYAYYTQYNKYGKIVYDQYFTLKKTRPEIYWNPERTILITPFFTPERSDVRDWLSSNVQDEWRGPGFNLKFDFKITDADIPHLEFKEGTTAHVNDIAGNMITMEAEYPVDTVDMKWTIRHEYGHVLGFQDCYEEFFDPRVNAVVYYEIDVDNLMCSRNGHLNASHIEQLQTAYK